MVRNAADQTAVAWKPGNNFVLRLPATGAGAVRVVDAWDETSRQVEVRAGEPAAA